MKKIVSLLMVFVLALAFTACSGNAEDQTEPSSENNAAVSEQSSDAPAEGTASAGGKTLVVYFSATGNTESAANYIAQATGGDLFELCAFRSLYGCGS